MFGWRYSPRIIFKAGRGVKLIVMDDREYYDLTSGMMCMVLGHSHPEPTEVMREMAGSFVHQSSWYANPWTIAFAERLAENAPGDLKVVNFAVTGSEANEIAMRMALAYTGKFDIVAMIRGLNGGQSRRRGDDQRRRQPPQGSRSAAACGEGKCPAATLLLSLVNREYPSCDVACLRSSEEMLEDVTSQDIAAIMVETNRCPAA